MRREEYRSRNTVRLKAFSPRKPSQCLLNFKHRLADNYVRRAFHTSLLLNNHVDVDGSEIAKRVNGAIAKAITNVTLTIDMRISWTNESVTFGSIGKPLIRRSSPPLRTRFLIFGGEKDSITESPLPPMLQL